MAQLSANDCGPACLAMALSYHGRPTSLYEILQRTELRSRGIDASSLLETARSLGLQGQGVRVEEVAALAELPPGTILHWQERHYVVWGGFSGRRARIVDPGVGRRWVSAADLERHFSGVALTLRPAADFSTEPPLEFRSIRSWPFGPAGWRRPLRAARKRAAARLLLAVEPLVRRWFRHPADAADRPGAS